MRYQEMVSTLLFLVHLNFSSIITSIFSVFLTFQTSNGIENHYRECSSLVSCGNISNVGYPFWGDHLRPQYCGHPAFELACPRQGSTSPPTLHIHGNQSSSLYSVLSINSSAMTILLQDFLPYNPPKDCLIPSSDLTDALGEDLIEYSPGVNIITLSYDCHQSKVKALVRLKNFSCLLEDAGTDIGYYYWNNQESEDELNRICKQSIKVPVIGKKHIEQGNVTLESVLKQGFEITYAKMFVNHCLPCQKSGGACSFSEVSGFVCYCKGWESSNYCKKSGKSGSPLPPKANAGNKNIQRANQR